MASVCNERPATRSAAATMDRLMLMKLMILSALTVLTCLGLAQPATFAQAADQSQNFSICMDGLRSCDRSTLSEAEAVKVAASDRRRNIADCRRDSEACDLSKLSATESRALAVARYQQNLSDCIRGGNRVTGPN